MPRRLPLPTLAATACLLAWSPIAEARDPTVPSTGAVHELSHAVDVELERGGATLTVTRDPGFGCEAALALYPIPPGHRRSVAYRVFVPSRYDEGRYAIELPRLDDVGLPAQLELEPAHDPELARVVDDRALPASALSLVGDQTHHIELIPGDPGRGHVRSVDLDLDALIAASPGATATLSAMAEPERVHGHLLEASFDAPAELAQLPRARRVVVVIDGSRSISTDERRALQRLAGQYLHQLDVHQLDPVGQIRAEILVFDRDVQPVYHDLVPIAWAAEDLPKLEIEPRNGSEIGEAMDRARTLLDTPSPLDGADWIVVLSDLELRSSFELEPLREATARADERVHVIRSVAGYAEREGGYGPANADDPWTELARQTGGMAWIGDPDQLDGALARELVSPTRLWSPRVELELADGSHATHRLGHSHEAGTRARWIAHDHGGAALVRAAFVGEIWGQRRAWTATPDPVEARRRAWTATPDPVEARAA